jgi:hypothetical protein
VTIGQAWGRGEMATRRYALRDDQWARIADIAPAAAPVALPAFQRRR